MNIPKINFAQNIQKLSQQKAVPRINQLACDTVSFSSNKENPMWIDFQSQVNSVCPDKTPREVVLDAV